MTLIEKIAEALIALDYPKGDYHYQTMGDDRKVYEKRAQAALAVVLGELESKVVLEAVNKAIKDEFKRLMDLPRGNTKMDDLSLARAALRAAADKLREGV